MKTETKFNILSAWVILIIAIIAILTSCNKEKTEPIYDVEFRITGGAYIPTLNGNPCDDIIIAHKGDTLSAYQSLGGTFDYKGAIYVDRVKVAECFGKLKLFYVIK